MGEVASWFGFVFWQQDTDEESFWVEQGGDGLWRSEWVSSVTRPKMTGHRPLPLPWCVICNG